MMALPLIKIPLLHKNPEINKKHYCRINTEKAVNLGKKILGADFTLNDWSSSINFEDY
jgi:hypothetical protein